MQRQWGNAVLTSLKRSEKEGAMCTECIRPQCNSRKVCLADRESLNQSTSFKNSCACRNGSASVSHCAKSLAQCNTWEGWPGQGRGWEPPREPKKVRTGDAPAGWTGQAPSPLRVLGTATWQQRHFTAHYLWVCRGLLWGGNALT